MLAAIGKLAASQAAALQRLRSVAQITLQAIRDRGVKPTIDR